MSTATTPPTGGPDTTNAQRLALIIGAAGLIAFGIIAIVRYPFAPIEITADTTPPIRQAFQSYSVAVIFWLGMPVGSLLLLMIQYLVFSRWGILLRRVLEANTRTLPLLAVLFIPVVVSFFLPAHSPYWWARPLDPQAGFIEKSSEEVRAEILRRGEDHKLLPDAKGDVVRPGGNPEVLAKFTHLEELQEKTQRYLNPTRAAIGAVIYFGVWLGLMVLLNTLSAKAEREPTSSARALLGKVAGPGIVAFALANTLAATDWVISLEYTWASTMFPVIYTVNQIITGYAFAIAVTLLLFRETLAKKIPAGYQIHLGSFLLAFTLFWTYTSFSQFLLVWVANLPEEIPFFLKRSQYGWQWAAAVLALFHFAVPFVLLLYRDVKSNPKALSGIAIMLLIVCFLDVMWWIEPASGHIGQPMFWTLDVAAMVGVGGLWFAFLMYQLNGRPLLPTAEKHALEDHHHG